MDQFGRLKITSYGWGDKSVTPAQAGVQAFHAMNPHNIKISPSHIDWETNL